MKVKYLVVVLLFLVLGSYLILTNKSNNNGSANNWKFEKVSGQTLYFSNNQKYIVDLHDLKYIGQLQTDGTSPLFIVSGRECSQCDENIAIYIYSPKIGLIKENGKSAKYSYPGKEFDYLDNKPTFESRMFYGECLHKNKDSIVWFQKEFSKDGNYKENSFSLEVVGESIKESIVKDNSLSIDQISKSCNELPGVDVTTTP